MTNKIFDMGKNLINKNPSAFIPEIWSKKLVKKFYDFAFLPPNHLLVEKTKLIMDLKSQGLSDDEILERMEKDDKLVKPWETWKFENCTFNEEIKVNPRLFYGFKILKPSAMATIKISGSD